MELKDVAYKIATQPEFAEDLAKAELPGELQDLPPEEMEALRVYLSKGNLITLKADAGSVPQSEDWWRP